jgi:hypothetical protein
LWAGCRLPGMATCSFAVFPGCYPWEGTSKTNYGVLNTRGQNTKVCARCTIFGVLGLHKLWCLPIAINILFISHLHDAMDGFERRAAREHLNGSWPVFNIFENGPVVTAVPNHSKYKLVIQDRPKDDKTRAKNFEQCEITSALALGRPPAPVEGTPRRHVQRSVDDFDVRKRDT